MKSRSPEIIVVSDMHLGSKKTHKKEFNKFLDYLKDEKDLEYFIINGDGLEFWGRDDAGVTLENADTIHKLMELNKSRKIYWIPGNHDYHLRNFRGHYYPFKFPLELVIKTSKIDYRFLHGYQFDPTEFEFLFDALCYTTNDSRGEMLYDAWKRFIRTRKFIEKFLLQPFYPKFKSDIKRMIRTPEERGIVDIVEENAKNSVKENEFLIFGHTHKGFVDNYSRIANSGAWFGNAPNTYLRIKRGKVKLEEF